MVTKIGALQMDLILKSSNFIAGMKASADATARATGSISHSMHEVNKVLKIAMGGGIAREFAHIFHALNDEAERTSEAYKKMKESATEAFNVGFGKGVDKNLKATNEQMQEVDKNAEKVGEQLGGAWTRGLAGVYEVLKNNHSIFEDLKNGNYGDAIWGRVDKAAQGATESIDQATDSTRDYVNELKKTDMLKVNETVAVYTSEAIRNQQAYNEAIKEGLGDESAWEPVLDANAKATESFNAEMDKLAHGIQDYTDAISSGIADAIVDAKSFDEALKDITKTIAKMAITSALQTIFNTGTTAMTGVTLHAGGEVGLSGGRRSMPGSAWANAPRFHGGFMPGEYPAILQRGESVLTRHQMSELKAGGTTFNMATNIDARGADRDGLARVESQLREMKRTLPTQVIRTVREARSRRVAL